MFYTCFSLYSRLQGLIMVRDVFLAFIIVIVLIGLSFFFIQGIVCMNVQLELIGRENLWPLQMFFPCICLQECTRYMCVCVWVCVCLCPSIHIYFQFFSPFLFLPPLLECLEVCICEYACL